MPSLVPPVVPSGAWAATAQPVIAGDGLRLRPWSAPDAAVLVEAYADEDIRRWHTRTMDPAEARAWIAAKNEAWQLETAADWAVEASREVVARVGFRWLELAQGRAEIAYWTHPTHRGRGLATRSVDTLGDWGLGHGLHRIDLHHATQNEASCRIARRCGYHLEGTAAGSVLHPDGWHDMHVHARLAS